MTILIDDTLVTAQIAVPFSEGWMDSPVEVSVRPNLRASDVEPADVALLPVPEATLLTETHVIAPEVAVIFDGIGPIAMRTPIRPDGVEETIVRLLETGPTAEVVMRALLRPYFGITATRFASADDDPRASEAQVVVVDGAMGLEQPESGFQDDLARAWFILTGQALVSHVTVVGVDALAHGSVDPMIDALRAAATLGVERRRDVRRIVAARWNIDRDGLAEMTNRMRFAMTPDDRQSLQSLIARGTWGSRFGRTLPAFRDALPTSDEPSEA
jgi:hypothetical protein